MGINYNKEYIYIRELIYKYMYILTQLHITVRSSFSPLDVKILENFFNITSEYCKGKHGYKNVNNEKRRKQ